MAERLLVIPHPGHDIPVIYLMGQESPRRDARTQYNNSPDIKAIASRCFLISETIRRNSLSLDQLVVCYLPTHLNETLIIIHMGEYPIKTKCHILQNCVEKTSIVTVK